MTPHRLHMLRQALPALLSLPLSVLLSTVLPAPAQAQSSQPQVAWSSAMSIGQGSSRANYTCRWIARPSLSGDAVRIRLSNAYSAQPLHLDAVTVARRTAGAAVTGLKPVSFGGARGVTIAAGGSVVSDALAFPVGLQQDLAVSIFVAGTNPVVTMDPVNTATSYCTRLDGSGGDHTADASDAAFSVSGPEMHWLDAIDVYTPSPSGAIVALGDSITNGLYADLDGNNRWLDILSNRLLAVPQPKSVANEGIGGDTACANSSANGAVDRLNRDVLAQSGASHVILFIGTNDLAIGTNGSTVLSCYQTVVSRLHAAGLKVIGGTMIPRSFDPTRESYRTQINGWIRSPGNFDGVIDFDAAVRDPANPVNIAPAFDDGDRIHPNPAGHLAMGNAIDLKLFGVTARSNLALGRPAAADSACTASQTAGKAVNGSFTGGGDDKWCSGSAAPWWQVDLGTAYEVNQVAIYHAGAGSESSSLNTRGYRVLTSLDGAQWTTQATATANTGSATAHNLGPTSARLVRVEVTAPQQGAGGAARLYEVQVSGSLWKPCATENNRCEFTGVRNVRLRHGGCVRVSHGDRRHRLQQRGLRRRPGLRLGQALRHLAGVDGLCGRVRPLRIHRRDGGAVRRGRAVGLQGRERRHGLQQRRLRRGPAALHRQVVQRLAAAVGRQRLDALRRRGRLVHRGRHAHRGLRQRCVVRVPRVVGHRRLHLGRLRPRPGRGGTESLLDPLSMARQPRS